MKLSVNLFQTFDGTNQGPGSAHEDTRGDFTRGGWLMPLFDDGVGAAVTNWFDQCGALLFGRNTYDSFVGHWPLVTDPNDPVAAKLNAAQKFVVTSRPLVSDYWRDSTTVLGEGFLTEVRELKSSTSDDDGELQVHGSIELARTLHEAGLIDIYRFIVAPVVVGGGADLFKEGYSADELASPAHTMQVTHSATTPNGCFVVEMVPGEFKNDLTAAVVDGQDVIQEQ